LFSEKHKNSSQSNKNTDYRFYKGPKYGRGGCSGLKQRWLLVDFVVVIFIVVSIGLNWVAVIIAQKKTWRLDLIFFPLILKPCFLIEYVRCSSLPLCSGSQVGVFHKC
jgi:hypothetical protein